ncbi:hypothetical protein MHYP_G00092440 [Metynnis hypsauchen]
MNFDDTDSDVEVDENSETTSKETKGHLDSADTIKMTSYLMKHKQIPEELSDNFCVVREVPKTFETLETICPYCPGPAPPELSPPKLCTKEAVVYGLCSVTKAVDVTVRRFAEESKAENPELLRSTKLRKQVTKLFQLLNLDQQELEQVARFMGHDIRVPCDFHRQRDKTLQLSRISKLLLSMEKETETIKDQNLNTLNFSVPGVFVNNCRLVRHKIHTKTDQQSRSRRRNQTMLKERTKGSFASFDLVFGAPPGDEAGCEPGPKFVTDLLDTLHNVHHAARVNLSDAGLKQKRAYDTRCSGEPLVVGHSVWLFSPKRTRGLCPKLQSNWVGPCSVVSKLGEVVYRVKWGKRRLVVHRDRLAPYRPKQRLCGQDINPLSPPSPERSQLDPTGSIDRTHVPAPTAPPAVGDAGLRVI